MNLKHNLPLLFAILAVIISLPLFIFLTLTQEQDLRSKAFVPPSTYYNRIAKLKITEFGTLVKSNAVSRLIESAKLAEITNNTKKVLGVTNIIAPKSLPLNNLGINTQVFDQLKRSDADNLFTSQGGKLKLYKIVIPDLSNYEDAEILFRSCSSQNVERCQAFSTFTERMYVFDSQYRPLMDHWGNWVQMDTRLVLKNDYQNNSSFSLPADRTLLIYIGSEGASKKDLPADFLLGFYTTPSGAYLLKTDDGRTYPVEPKGFTTTCFAGKPCVPEPVLDLYSFIGKKVFAEGVMTQYYTETCSGKPQTCLSNDMIPWWPLPSGLQFEVEKIQVTEIVRSDYVTSGQLVMSRKYAGENVYILNTAHQPSVFVRSSYQDLKRLINNNLNISGQLLSVGSDRFINLNNSPLTPSALKKIDFKVLKEGDPTSGYANKSIGRINDTREFQRVWKNFFGNSKTPSFDFNKNTIFYVSKGETRNGGHTARFTEILEYSDKVVVKAEFVQNNCPSDQALHYPYQFIYVEKNTKPFVFEEVTLSKNCPTSIPVSPKAILFFVPKLNTVRVNQNFSIYLSLNTQGLKVTALDANLAFDPQSIKINSAIVQDSFPNHFVKPQIDNRLGKIRFAVGSEITKPVEGLATPVLLISATALKETNTTIISLNSAEASAVDHSADVLGPTEDFKLTIINNLLGDIDFDKDVDIFDYNLLIQDFGKNICGLTADITKDCKVDIFDYNILLEDFGKKI